VITVTCSYAECLPAKGVFSVIVGISSVTEQLRLLVDNRAFM